MVSTEGISKALSCLPVKGQRTSIRAGVFERPGIYHAVCDAMHPWMSAFIVVTEHPYYTVTDNEGKFNLKNVPPGTYELMIWHGGVNIKDTRTSRGEIIEYRYEEPYTISKKIEVKPETEIRVDLTLELRE